MTAATKPRPLRAQRFDRAVSWALGSPRVALGLALAFALAGWVGAMRATFLHDEGLLTYDFAAWLGHAPGAVAFLQKAKVVPTLLYALPARAGLGWFQFAHVLVAAAALPMIAAVARRLEVPAPNVTAVVLGASPLYFAGAVAGFSNTDAVAAQALFLYLLVVRERPVAAGVVLGALPWVRFELAPLVAVFGLYALVVRQPRLLAGVLVFPALYALAGALYHRDALWMLHFPPTLASPMPGNPVWLRQHASHGVASVTLALLDITPVFLLAGLARASSLTRVERAGVAFAALYLAAMQGMPAFEFLNFGYSPRYSLQVLPYLALLVARAVGASTSTGRRAALPLLGLGAFMAEWALRRGAGAYPYGAVWACTAVVALGRVGWAAVATCVAALGLPFVAPPVEGTRRETAPYLDEVTAWLRAHPREIEGHAVYTNAPLLAAYAARAPGLAHVRVRFVVQRDQLYEIDGLADPRNGQREALRAQMRSPPVGEAVMPDDLRPDAVPVGSVFVLRPDARTTSLLETPAWQRGLRPRAELRGARVLEWVGGP